MGINNRHAASLTSKEAVDAATIAVENIDAPILLLSGGRDPTWPASRMGAEICATVNGSGSDASCEHVIYEYGDHLLSNYQTESFRAVARFLNSVHENRPADTDDPSANALRVN